MHERADKGRDNQNKAAANEPSQRTSSRVATFEFDDNRAEAVRLRKLQVTADNSPQAGRTHQAAGDVSEPVQRLLGLQRLPDDPVRLPVRELTATVQRFEKNAEGLEFDDGATVDCTATLVVRADRLFTPSNKVLETFTGNEDKKIAGKKGAISWEAGTSTGQSVMANTAALPAGKKITVVKSIPDSLEIVQVNAANHAELHTTREMSNKEITQALKEVKLVDQWDGEVAQLTQSRTSLFYAQIHK